MADSEAQRIVWLVRSLGYTQRRFAEALGVSAQLVSDIARVRSRVSRDLAEAIAERFRCSLDWLLLGIGEPFPDMTTTTTTQPGARTARVRVFPPRCEDCGQELRQGDRFCPGCHAALEWPAENGSAGI